ncbi:MAG TPA: ring-cleaving dioxygenase [Thermoanaerobaculia bacterium]|nr:ring-cleaving dioxygenase [Thermoanaerobaculia bacterium]
MRSVTGLHHVTAISGPAQENLDFYAGVLGMRLVKKSVNQDDPGTYHLFYADAEGHPGTDLTFFPWAHLAPPRPGHGTAPEVSLAVPAGSLEFWGERLERFGAALGTLGARFGERTLPLRDPHGMAVALVELESASESKKESANRRFTSWEESPVPAERQVRGLHGARLRERDIGSTTAFLAGALGFRHVATEGAWQRWAVGDGGSGSFVDVAEAPGERRGAWGVGAIHHLAWRVDDEEHQLAVRRQVEPSVHPTPVIDRFWFKSVYFKEPGGVLLELATEGPGFAVDEDPRHLGESLVLPPWLEPQRGEIERSLPPLAPPKAVETVR